MPVSYNSMHTIDINCDVGEGYPYDAELMQYISSANIACGWHAGRAVLMQQTVRWAIQYGVAIGAQDCHAKKSGAQDHIPNQIFD